MKKIGPLISETTDKFLLGAFRTRNAGATYIMEMTPALYAREIHSLKGLFTIPELCLIVDAFEGASSSLVPRSAGQNLCLRVKDGIELDHLDRKWKTPFAVSPGGPEPPLAIFEKIKGLSAFSKACLEIWASAFWERKLNRGERRDLPKWVDQLK
jgi:hypothetical protein